ncbi:UNVERIFIED_CONTAM: hypothetical protein PYX00_011608 [Menopon gallinae]|uniref:non-specific serine/threonine protein kinase n=1 Tax=Menopon gallinae TaxID=328185 RepID=A0AAW2H847_9NEOP
MLMDSAYAVYHELQRGRYQNVSHQLAELARVHEEHARVCLDDFEVVGLLARGAYGEVFVARRGGAVYAIKRVLKETAVQQPFTALFMAEKELMVDARGSEWLLYAHWTFQDEEAVYYVTDFLPGGDFMGYLVRQESVAEHEVRFYGAEVVAALEELHALGYVHRDLKPENMLIDADGHIRLADFGSCARTVDGRVRCRETVGTPDYVSPEVLCGAGCEVEYGCEVDLWALGVVLYEMLYEAPPFYSESLQETYERIANIDLRLPSHGSAEFRDLLARLLCRREERLALRGVKSHAFFAGTDWGALRRRTPPFVPHVAGDADMSNFERAAEGSTLAESECGRSGDAHFLNFVGFTFDPDCVWAAPCVQDADVPAVHEAAVCAQGPPARDASTQCAAQGGGAQLRRRLQNARVCLEAAVNGMRELHAALEHASAESRLLRLDLGDAQSYNTSLVDSLNVVSLENRALRERERSSRVQAYKKELRIKRTEVKEFQQKLEAEIVAKNKMEDEVVALRREVERLSRCRDPGERNTSFRVRVVGDGGALTAAELSVQGLVFRLLESEANVNNVVVRPLKDNELFRMGGRERSLALCISVIDEMPRAAAPCVRASEQMLADAIEKEERIQEGIERIMRVSAGAADAQAQLEGSRRRLAYLRGELERGRRTGTLDAGSACEKLYEYNNHVFRVQTFPPQTLCEHCNDVLRGSCGQGLGCDECGMVVHRNCYVLTDTSCEMFSALSRGKRYYVVMRNLEERERLLRWARIKEQPVGRKVPLGRIEHMCGESAVARVACDGIPLPGAPLFLEGGERVGAVDEVLGPLGGVCVSFVPAGKTCQRGTLLLAPETKILAAERFLPRHEAIAEKERGDRRPAPQRSRDRASRR